MPKNALLVILVLPLLYLTSLFGQVQYENQTVKSVEIIVHTKVGVVTDSNSVQARLKTIKDGFFSQCDFDEDLKTLSQDFDRIEPTIIVDDEGQISILIDLWSKPTIRSICWHGNHHIKTCNLEGELKIQTCSEYDRVEFNTAFHKLKAFYMKKGYFEAELDYNTTIDCETNEIDISITIHEGRSGKIQEINFINFTDCEESEILKQMVTKKYNIFISWMNDQGVYNADAITQDKLVITNYLQNQGYADAQVEIDVAETCNANRILITITADKGERYYFGDLSFEGNKILCDGDIDCAFIIRKGDTFSLEKIRNTIGVLSDAYGKLGYIDAVIDFEPELIDDSYCYKVHFKIEEGEQYRIGLIRVLGNTVTRTSVILHETLLIPGEVFNIIKLKATEERLGNVGYFKNVNVYFVKGTESPLGGNYRDVYIEVEETGTGQFSAFLGYSTAELLFGGINITERNFNHEGFYYFNRDGMCGLRGGGEYAHFTAQIGQKSRNYTISWTKPYFMDTQWTIGFDLSKSCTEYISKDYEIDTLSLVLRAQYDINSYVRFGSQYRLKNGVVHLHHHGDRMRQLVKASNVNGLISAVGSYLSYDSTDHPVKPSYGFRSKVMAEFAGVGGDHSFFSLAYLNSYFLEVGSRMTLIYRADFRFIQPLFDTTFNTIPLDERIFLGGDFNVRGYRPYRLGPRFDHDDDAPKGGISMQLYSVELDRRVTEDYEAFIFFDSAHLSDDPWSFGRMSCSVGFGARCKFLASIPPITLGLGFPLNARSRSEVKKFFISVGGNF